MTMRYRSSLTRLVWRRRPRAVGATVLLAAMALAQPQKWEEGVNLVIGLWLIVAPFALGFANDPGSTWNHVLVGLVTGGDALWALLQPPLRGAA